jgi:hypothetical protein
MTVKPLSLASMGVVGNLPAEMAQDLYAHAASLETGVTPTMAREDRMAFLRYVIVDENNQPLVPDDFTRLYVDSWEHLYTVKRHLSFVSPPATGKTVLSLAMTIKAIGQNPKLRTVLVSADVADSENACTLCRQIVLTDHYREVFPNMEPDVSRSMDARGWKKGEWFARAVGQRKDPTMAARAAVPKRESMRVDIGNFDDVVTEKTANEVTTHETIVNAFHKTWVEGRARPRGWIIYNQNIRKKNDLAHRLRLSPKFCSIWVGVDGYDRLFVEVWNAPPDLPLLTDPGRYNATPVETLDREPRASHRFLMPLPSRPNWTPQELRDMDPSAYIQLYRLEAVSPEDLVLKAFGHETSKKPVTVSQLLDLDEDPGTGLPLMDDMDRFKYAVVLGVDLSSAKRAGTALWWLAIDGQGNVYTLEHDRGAWSTDELADRIQQAWDRGIQPRLIYVENVGMQDQILTSLRTAEKKGQRYPWKGALEGYTTGSGKFDATLGVPGLDTDFRTGTLLWAGAESSRGLPHSRHWRTAESNAGVMTLQVLKSKPPDEWMSLWFAREASRKFIGGKQPKKAQTIKVKERSHSGLGRF